VELAVPFQQRAMHHPHLAARLMNKGMRVKPRENGDLISPTKLLKGHILCPVQSASSESAAGAEALTLR
jgi:hypothetical protein